MTPDRRGFRPTVPGVSQSRHFRDPVHTNVPNRTPMCRKAHTSEPHTHTCAEPDPHVLKDTRLNPTHIHIPSWTPMHRKRHAWTPHTHMCRVRPPCIERDTCLNLTRTYVHGSPTCSHTTAKNNNSVYLRPPPNPTVSKYSRLETPNL